MEQASNEAKHNKRCWFLFASGWLKGPIVGDTRLEATVPPDGCVALVIEHVTDPTRGQHFWLTRWLSLDTAAVRNAFAAFGIRPRSGSGSFTPPPFSASHSSR